MNNKAVWNMLKGQFYLALIISIVIAIAAIIIIIRARRKTDTFFIEMIPDIETARGFSSRLLYQLSVLDAVSRALVFDVLMNVKGKSKRHAVCLPFAL